MTAASRPDFTVRDARPADLDVIVEFNRRLAEETESKALDLAVLANGVRRGLADPVRLRYWVVEDAEGRIIGQTAVTREWSDWRDGWIWWLQSVYIAEDHRGRGVFKDLYVHIRRAALDDPDVIGLRLYMEDGNDRARRAYLALGLVEAGYSVLEDLWIASRRPDPGNQAGA